jgi:glycosyltransferase involved in cell wall biosynthesis
MRSPGRDVPRLTIITPVYNEAENLDAYASAVEETILSRGDLDARILLVDDGSSDDSWAKIVELTRRSVRFSGLRLSRNFGVHIALAAGFDNVGEDADIVAVLACDLQDPPLTVLEFVARWREGADIVWGARRERADSGWRRIASHTLDRILRLYAMPRDSKFRTGSFLLIDRVVLECFLKCREHNRVTFALVAWTGFSQDVVYYDRQARLRGRSGWSLGRMISTAYDVFIGFSPFPARVLTGLGFALFGISILVLIYLVTEWFVKNVQPGWTGIMALITVFFGILFMMVGMIAEYLYRIFIETKARPLYFVASRTHPRREDSTQDA